MRIATLALATLGLLALTACNIGGKSCTDLYAYGLTVSVVDDASGDPICTATVDIADGAYTEQLMAFGTTPPCDFVGAGERAGTYGITVASMGYAAKTVSNIIVGEDEDQCHVKGESVTVRLVAP